jgi:hypothetical protein
VAITTIEAEVPSEFPPARLFLDDIEEIAGVLVASAQNRKRQGDINEDPAPTKLTFTVKDRVCDEAQELPKIAKNTIWLMVKAERQYWSMTVLRFSRYSTTLGYYGVTREEQLSTFYSLAPIFKRRKLWLATLLHFNRVLVLALMFFLILAQLTLAFMFKKQTALIPVIVIGFLLVAIGTTLVATTRHHSIVILRHSSESSTARQEMISKSIPIVASNILSFILGLLALYIKHKYWP